MSTTLIRAAAGPAAQRCRCGHARTAHEHFRSGSDCALCGHACRSFHRAGGGPLVARLRHALHRH